MNSFGAGLEKAEMSEIQKSQLVIAILNRLATELEDTQPYVEELHELVELCLRRGIGDSPEFIRGAQNIDILQQRLSGLAHYLQELAELTPGHWAVEGQEAARKLKLSKLVERLSHLGEDCRTSSEHSAGEMEVF